MILHVFKSSRSKPFHHQCSQDGIQSSWTAFYRQDSVASGNQADQVTLLQRICQRFPCKHQGPTQFGLASLPRLLSICPWPLPSCWAGSELLPKDHRHLHGVSCDPPAPFWPFLFLLVMIPVTFPAWTPLPGQMHLSIYFLPMSPWGLTGWSVWELGNLLKWEF